ncbi:hypothetical protein [Sphingobium yanoikuyae]|uniref:hypothetical protein n=1 Tax=Sphingobium yanoikuyae TaxID=13690 RepID=UPI0026ECE99D|nr:hypothetical protein [Sphingobium yanoikuyae]
MIRFHSSPTTTIDRQTVVARNWRLIFGRITLTLTCKTSEGAQIDRDLIRWSALRAEAVAASDAETVEFALDDLWAAGGTWTTAEALMRRIIDGSYRPSW